MTADWLLAAHTRLCSLHRADAWNGDNWRRQSLVGILALLTLPTMANPHDKALSYYDVLLRNADIQLLRGNHWLNDQVHLSLHLLHDHRKSVGSQADQRDMSTYCLADHRLLL
jgi:hypothetical protein